MKCKCGYQNRENAVFCAGCGRKLNVEKTSILQKVLMVILVLLIVALCYVIFRGEEAKEQPNGSIITYGEDRVTSTWTEQMEEPFIKAGKSKTSEKTIESDHGVADSDGKSNTKTLILPDYQIPTSRYSGEQMEYKHNNGASGGADYWILNTPIKNCTSITVSVNVLDYKAGNVDNWGFYVRNMTGKWMRIGSIDIHDLKGQSVFTLDTPITFDAYSFPCESLEDWWDFSYTFELSNIEVINNE